LPIISATFQRDHPPTGGAPNAGGVGKSWRISTKKLAISQKQYKIDYSFY